MNHEWWLARVTIHVHDPLAVTKEGNHDYASYVTAWQASSQPAAETMDERET